MREAIDAVMAVDKRDIDDVPGLVELWDELAELIDDLCATPAIGVADVIAKAELAILFAGYAGDRGARIALSLAGDILASRPVD